jgi:ABC-2 type transport system ATP-binding protein
MMGNEPAFALRSVVKRYTGFQLGPIDLSLAAGTVMGLIGPNGAGKTTLVDCVVGFARTDTGEARVFGVATDWDRVGWKREVGYVGGRRRFYERWSGRRNLEFVAGTYAVWDDPLVEALARRLELPLDQRVDRLSTGNRTKLMIVSAVGHRPGLLLLDEPFVGLDPLVRSEALDVLWQFLEERGISILFATHQLSDIERLADELASLDRGTVVANGSRDDVLEGWRRVTFAAATDVQALPGVVERGREGALHRVVTEDWGGTRLALNKLGATHVSATRMSLEEIAVSLMRRGRSARDAGGREAKEDVR